MKQLGAIAATIASEPFRLIPNRPAPWAEAGRCFENVVRKIDQDGGAVVFGWTFHLRQIQSMPGQSYVFATHHAVWQHPSDGALIDITPFPDPHPRPLPGWGYDNLFQVDRKSIPTVVGRTIIPLPVRFFALTNDAWIVAHVKALTEEEEKAARQMRRRAQRPAENG